MTARRALSRADAARLKILYLAVPPAPGTGTRARTGPQAAELRDQMLAARQRGATLAAIGNALGITREGVRQRLAADPARPPQPRPSRPRRPPQGYGTARCPEPGCGRDFALRGDGMIRDHRVAGWNSPQCPGGGRPPAAR